MVRKVNKTPKVSYYINKNQFITKIALAFNSLFIFIETNQLSFPAGFAPINLSLARSF
ncbi:MAG: hypothetical protein JW798_05345 [Prolixibacteraceae bacterium]|nr:hypothetical protein [Prolixibacteraceae bacterium]